MRIVRFNTRGNVKCGVLENNAIHGMKGSLFTQFKGPGSSYKLDGSTYNLGEVKLLAPCKPSKIVCVGGNHVTHCRDVEKAAAHPLMFDKPSTSVIGPEDTIVLPDPGRFVTYEGELAVVIGKKAKDVAEEHVDEYVLGYTCHNDIGDIDILNEDASSHTRGKGFDTFSPIGPWIETDINPNDLKIETHLNGELCQSDRTGGLVVGITKLVSFFSSVMTLLPGDVVSTGTPGKLGTERLKPGDVLELTIEKIGTMRNYIASKNNK